MTTRTKTSIIACLVVIVGAGLRYCGTHSWIDAALVVSALLAVGVIVIRRPTTGRGGVRTWRP